MRTFPCTPRSPASSMIPALSDCSGDFAQDRRKMTGGGAGLDGGGRACRASEDGQGADPAHRDSLPGRDRGGRQGSQRGVGARPRLPAAHTCHRALQELDDQLPAPLDRYPEAMLAEGDDSLRVLRAVITRRSGDSVLIRFAAEGVAAETRSGQGGELLVPRRGRR